MTLNIATHPNSAHLCGDITMGFRFGEIYSVTPIVLSGAGHAPHVAVRFKFGLTLELDAATAVELANRLPKAVERLPEIPDCHDAIGVADE